MEFTSESDADLLGYMGMRECEPEARDAFAEFYCRHAKWLYNTLCRGAIIRLVGDEEGAKDVVHLTFLRAYNSAHTFDSGGTADSDSSRRRVRAWLGRIANNVIHDILRAPDALNAAVAIPKLPDGMPEREPTELSPKAQLVRDALDTLSDREKDIVLEAALHYKMGEEHQRLPNEVSSALARKWSTTPENIRAIRSRAFRKIKETVERQELQRSQL